MKRNLAIILGVIIGLLAIIGLFVSGRLFGLINVDIFLDIVRIPIAGALLYVGFADVTDRARTTVLEVVGVLVVILAIIGLFDREVFWLLPSGLTAFDIILNLIGGFLAIFIGLNPEEESVTVIKDENRRY